MIPALLVAVTIALYWPLHGYDFVGYDDGPYVRLNPPVLAGLTPASVAWAFTTMHAGLWIPLTWLSLMADSQLFGTGAGGYHAINVLLHAVDTLLLFVLLARLTHRRWPSAFVACLFAVHPLHVESVAWIAERKDVLSTLFLLLTLWSHARWAGDPTPRRYLLTLLCFALGLLAKPMLVTVPILLLLLDLWPLGRVRSVSPSRLLLEKVPFVALAVAAAVVTFVAQRRSGAVAPLAALSVAVRVANALESYVLYLAKTLWPSGLAAFYPYPGPPTPWRPALCAIVLAGVTALAVGAVRRAPYLTVGWLWYVLTLAPVCGLVQVGPQAMGDRFTYVPLIGIFVAVAWGASDVAVRWRRGPIALTTAAGIVIAACIATSAAQLRHWRDGVTLFEHAVAVTGTNPVAQHLLGLALADQGRTDEAMARYAEALRIQPDSAETHDDLGRLLLDRGDAAEAMAHFEAALQIRPDDAYAHATLGTLLAKQGRIGEAVVHYREAVRLEPRNPASHNNLGRVLADQRRIADAVAEYGVALELDPDDADAHGNLANALAAQGKSAEALHHFDEALRIRPDYVAARVNLGLLLFDLGRPADAIAQYQRALEIDPTDARVHGDLADALAAAGKLDDAVAHYTETLRRDPTDARAHNNVANALVMLGRVPEGLGHYGEALRLDPGYAEAHHNLAMVLVDQGRADEAVEHYATALRLKPDYTDAHTHLGIVLVAQGRTDEAIAHFTEALRLDPNDATARQQLESARGGRR